MKRVPRPERIEPREPPEPPPVRPPGEDGKRWLMRGIAGLLLIAGLVWAFRTVSFYMSHVETDDAQVEGKIVPISPKVEGYVTAVEVVDNQRVEEGAVLVTIEARDYEAVVGELLAGLSPERFELAVAIASLPERIRGFDSVKEASAAEAKAREAELLAAFRASGASGDAR